MSEDSIQSNPPERRTPGFKPGQSGNPGGLPKWMKEFREHLKGLSPRTHEVAKKILDRALRTEDLEKVINDGESAPEAVLAAEKALATRMDQAHRMTAEIWSYTLTKPRAKLQLSGSIENPFAGMSTEEILTIAGRRPEESK